jgi:phage-related protein
MALGKGVALIVSIIGDTKGLEKSLGSAGGEVKGFGGDALAMAAKVTVVAGVALAAGAAIASMAKAAADDRAEQQKLEAAITAAGAATAKSTEQVEAAIAAGQDRAFTDSETREGLQSLVTATKDVGVATDLLAQAQDLARFAGVDLATASDAVAKAYAGNDKALRSLVPGLEKGATASETLANASKAAAGQADIYSKSAAGMQAKAGDAFGELSETIGEVFLPVLDAVLPIVIQMIKLFGQLVKAVLPLLIPILNAVGKALTIVGNILSTVIGWLIKFIDWITKGIGMIGDFLDKINPLKDIKLPFGIGSQSATGASASTRAGTQSAGSSAGGGVTFNIYGDPSVIEAKVTKALRDYARRNGKGSLVALGTF